MPPRGIVDIQSLMKGNMENNIFQSKIKLEFEHKLPERVTKHKKKISAQNIDEYANLGF